MTDTPLTDEKTQALCRLLRIPKDLASRAADKIEALERQLAAATARLEAAEASLAKERTVNEYLRLSQVPIGHVPVPREPTDAMLDAGHSAGDFHIMHYDGIDRPGTPRYSLRKSWFAMIDAAQGSNP